MADICEVWSRYLSLCINLLIKSYREYFVVVSLEVAVSLLSRVRVGGELPGLRLSLRSSRLQWTGLELSLAICIALIRAVFREAS